MKTIFKFGFSTFLIITLLCLPQAVQAVGFTLTLVAQGPGTVSKNPNNATYPPGVTVTITNIPNAGAYFTGWTGDTNSSSNSLNIVMNNNYTITGNFLAYPTYPLTLTTNGQGTIAISPSGTLYASNTLVTATATPANGWIFTGWTGSAAGVGNPLSFSMNSANSLTGNFAQLPAFDVQPMGVTNIVGANVSLSAHSVGTAPLTYQWYLNGAGVMGATSPTLNFNNVQIASAGSYRVVATNLYGSATSSVALLVVTNGFSNPVSVCDEPSLRAAIAAGGWIQFGCNGTITLANPIVINTSVVLDASLVNATISGGNLVRLFYVSNGASLTITNLTLANGMTNNSTANNADGGAIYNNGGTLDLIGCKVLNNTAHDTFSFNSNYYPARGGAIFNNGGTVVLSGTFLSNNMASGTNIGFNGAGASLGGAIYMTNGSLTLINCVLASNACQSCLGESFGGAICVRAGTAVFSNCQFNANHVVGLGAAHTALFEGGAVAVLDGNLTLKQCQFLNNDIQDLGSIYVSGSQGGALFSAGMVNIQDSTFLNNQIAEASLRGNNKVNAQGGAIYNSGNLTLNGSCIASNLVWGLDGIMSSGGTSQAGDGLGGGIYNAGQLKMTNCTITLNTAHGGTPAGPGGGFVYGNAIGAGLYNETNATSVLMNVTLANNSSAHSAHAASGFSAGDQVANNVGGTLRLHNSLIAYTGTNGNAYGTITDDGYNISSDGSAAFASGSSYNFTDPKLGPLADNGGPTLSIAPLADSPAIDFGDANGAPNSDQRGLLRPFGAGYDMGAVEYGSVYPAPSAVMMNYVRNGTNLSLGFAMTPTITYHLQSTTNVMTNWLDEQVFGPFSYPSNITVNVSLRANAKKFFRVWY